MFHKHCRLLIELMINCAYVLVSSTKFDNLLILVSDAAVLMLRVSSPSVNIYSNKLKTLTVQVKFRSVALP